MGTLTVGPRIAVAVLAALLALALAGGDTEKRPPRCIGPGSPLREVPDVLGQIDPPLSAQQRLSLLRYVLHNAPLEQPFTESLWYGLLNLRPGEVHKKLEGQREAGERQFCEHTVADAPLTLLQESRKWLEHRVQPGHHYVDFGSGVGEPCLFMAVSFAGLKITGYEVSPEKVAAANKAVKEVGLADAEFIVQDLSDPNFIPPKADFYYMWNPVSPDVLNQLLRRFYQRYLDGEVFSFVTNRGITWQDWTSKKLAELPWLRENTTLSAEVKTVDMPPIGIWKPAVFDQVPLREYQDEL